MTGAQQMISRLKNVRETSNGWEACCPSHEDKDPSLSVSETDDGKVVFHCHAGCSQESVLQALGIKWADLFPSRPTNGRGQLGEIVAAYDYQEESGELLFQVLRYSPKTFRQRRPDGNNGWIWSTKDTRKVLYHLPEISSAIEADQLIFIVEGEEDVHSLERLGLSATTNPGGATKWRDEYSKSLREAAEVVILPDNDDVGRTHAEQVATSLHGVTLVKVLELPGLPEHGDVRDWLRSGGTVHELFRLAKEAPEWKPSEPAPSKSGDVPITEDDLALQFTERHKDDLRYVNEWGRWFRWDSTRWGYERTLAVYDLARRVTRDVADRVEKRSLRTRIKAASTVAAIVSLARSDRAHARVSEDFDQHSMLLNTPAGTVDLETGRMRAHCRDDYLTKVTPVPPATPGEEAPLWRSCLRTWTEENEALEKFLQRLCGYFLTGSTREEKLVIVYGGGANGKTKFIEAIRSSIGTDYATGIAMDTLIVTKGEQHPTDVASLRGKRLAVATETEQGRRLAESKVKMLTGGDRLRARFMRQDFFEFDPSHKLLIFGNHRPTLRNVDEAMRRRVLLVPFTATIEKRDDRLAEKLESERPGILRWMIDGCLEWQRIGLAPPPIVLEETEKYFQDQDAVGRWMEECCLVGKNATATKSELWESWKKWAEGANEYVGSKRWLLDRLRESVPGLDESRTKKSYLFIGIGLLVRGG